MVQIVECIPNISEGRRPEVVEACVNQIRNTAGCILLDYSSDASHNRSVITYAGSPEAVGEAGVRLVKKAAELIDLTKQSGEHPRMGAVDVMPLVPIRGCTVSDCIALSEKTGKRIAEEAGVPVFLYEQSAKKKNRKNLADIRQGQFEGMAEKVRRPEWEPDFGGRRIHPTAGVTAVGARPPLIAYNLNLDTGDVNIAKAIAKTVREKDGGLKCVKALGFEITDDKTGRKFAQVSMNMTNFRETSLYEITERVKVEAAKYGAVIKEAELIGLCPAEAFAETAAEYLKIKDFNYRTQVLEEVLSGKSAE